METVKCTLKTMATAKPDDGALYLGKVELGCIGTADSDVQIIDVVFSKALINRVKELNDLNP